MAGYHPELVKLLKRLADEEGIPFVIEPGYGYVAQLTTKRGERRYLRLGLFDVNGAGAKAVASDKAYTTFFLEQLGYPTPKGKAFYSPAWAKAIGEPKKSIRAAYEYALSIGLPVIVKPNSKSEGVGVSKVRTKREFFSATKHISTLDRVFLVQEIVRGRDYRVVVYDGEVVAAYERVPFSVLGDGVSSVKKLLQEKFSVFTKHGRHVRLTMHDSRIKKELQAEGLSFRSVLSQGVVLRVLPNANLSTGGEGKNVIRTMHKAWKETAVQLSKDVGLSLVGIDFLVEGGLEEAPQTNAWCVLEVNPAPQLNHFATIGNEEKLIVETLYRTILRRLWEG